MATLFLYDGIEQLDKISEQVRIYSKVQETVYNAHDDIILCDCSRNKSMCGSLMDKVSRLVVINKLGFNKDLISHAILSNVEVVMLQNVMGLAKKDNIYYAFIGLNEFNRSFILSRCRYAVDFYYSKKDAINSVKEIKESNYVLVTAHIHRNGDKVSVNSSAIEAYSAKLTSNRKLFLN